MDVAITRSFFYGDLFKVSRPTCVGVQVVMHFQQTTQQSKATNSRPTCIRVDFVHFQQTTQQSTLNQRVLTVELFAENAQKHVGLEFVAFII